MVLCIHAGRRVTAALAVIEDGHATYTSGRLTWNEIRSHFSKIDVAFGTFMREPERLRTETYLEEMYATGIAPAYEETKRYYQDDLTLKIPTHVETVEVELVRYLKSKGFSVSRAGGSLHVRHLERMRHRTGYILREVEYEPAD